MADDGVKIGFAYFEIGAKDSKLKPDFERAKTAAKKQVEEMNAQLSKIKMSVEASALKMKFEEVKKWQNDLRVKFEKQIKMNADVSTIQKTKAALDSVTSSLSGMQKEVSTTAKIWDSLKGFAGSLGIIFGVGATFSFGKQAVEAAADLEVLRSNFKGTEQDLELFRVATARTVTDANLIKLSNQASDLGISLEQQALFFSLAEDAADKYGGGVEEGMSKVIMASEGNAKALKSLGIQKKVFEEILKGLTQEYVHHGETLDADTLKQIRIQAILQATGVSLDDVKKKTQDSKDKIEGLSKTFDDFKVGVGKKILPTIQLWIDSLTKLLGVYDRIKDSPVFKKLMEASPGGIGTGSMQHLPKESEIVPKELSENSGNKNGLTIYATKEQMDQINQSGTKGIKTITAYANGVGEVKTQWKAAGKTVDEIKQRIADLTVLQGMLVPKSKEYAANVKEIASLTKQITPKTEDSFFGDFNKNKKDLAEVNKLLKDKNLTDAQRNILLERQLQLSAQIFKYEHPDTNVNPLANTGKLPGIGKQGAVGSGGGNIANPAINQMKQWEDEANSAQQATERLANTLASAFSQGASSGNNLVGMLGQMVTKFGEVILQASVFKVLMAGLNLIPGVGSALSWLGLGGHEGGTFMNNTRVPAFANGVDSYRVPNGYPNDSFPVMVQSGEDLRVRTPAQRNMAEMNNQALISEVTAMKKSIQALNINMSTKSNEVTVPVYMDGKMVAVGTTKHQNDFDRFNNKVSR